MVERKRPNKVKAKGQTKQRPDKEVVELKDTELQEVTGGGTSNLWNPLDSTNINPNVNLSGNIWQFKP